MGCHFTVRTHVGPCRSAPHGPNRTGRPFGGLGSRPMTISQPEAPPTEQVHPVRRPGLEAGVVDIGVLLCYVALAVWVLGPLLAQPGQVRPESNPADPDIFEWMLRHAVRIF